MELKNLTYIYQSGRIKRLNKKEDYPDEFFYGLSSLKNKFENTSVIEFEDNNMYKIFKFCFYILRKISGLPIYSEQLLSRKNIKLLRDSNLIILSNQRMGFSALPLLLINKLFKKQTSCVFVMGLYNINTKKKLKLLFRKVFTSVFLNTIDKIIFLSEGEYNYSNKKYKKIKNKFSFLPFCVDTKFWSSGNSHVQVSNNILFVGNDGMRDYKFAIEIAENMPDYQFTFITKNINHEDLKSNNIELINGLWSEETLTDNDIKNLYIKSALTIIPIKESLQPSGQSVALQSMSMGVPVVITKTEGFWEPNVYLDEKNIVFTEKNDISEWKNKIIHTLSNKEYYKKLAECGKETVFKNNNLDNFNNELNKILFN
tara:strand:+ start:553 stop:1665 length:1113 start_codon:yes stop_codon:yes gene_type:complete